MCRQLWTSVRRQLVAREQLWYGSFCAWSSAWFFVTTNGCFSSYKRVTVVKMSSIVVPSNLSPDSECQALWGNISQAGMDMDDYSDDWNDVVLDSATLLIEEGCVQNTRRGF